MPESIKGEHIERMFPFEFFDELSEQIQEYKLLNVAFAINERNPIDKESRRYLFNKTRKEQPIGALYKVNITQVDPFGDVLLLDICVAADKLNDLFITDKTAHSQNPITILIVQLYDRNKNPVFTTAQDESIIASIPELLWDDPNLMISMLTFDQEGAKTAILKAPDGLIDKWTEPIEKNNNEEDQV